MDDYLLYPNTIQLIIIRATSILVFPVYLPKNIVFFFLEEEGRESVLKISFSPLSMCVYTKKTVVEISEE